MVGDTEKTEEQVTEQGRSGESASDRAEQGKARATLCANGNREAASLWSGKTADSIALLFVYMPIIRREINGCRPVECTYHPTAG